MQERKARKPTESPADSDPAERLMARLRAEGFTPDTSEDEWKDYGEIIYRREEKISFASGETVFIFTALSDLDERILRQTSQSVVLTYRARSATQKAMSVLQSTTVFHCLVLGREEPHNEDLNRYIRREGGATFIPVIIVPSINHVVYPNL